MVDSSVGFYPNVTPASYSIVQFPMVDLLVDLYPDTRLVNSSTVRSQVALLLYPIPPNSIPRDVSLPQCVGAQCHKVWGCPARAGVWSGTVGDRVVKNGASVNSSCKQQFPTA